MVLCIFLNGRFCGLLTISELYYMAKYLQIYEVCTQRKLEFVQGVLYSKTGNNLCFTFILSRKNLAH